jgi:hypothetical protein
MTRKSKTLDEPLLRLEYRDPTTLREHDRNWRRHPHAQMAALGESLDRAGWAGAVLYNEATGRLIDGHARRQAAIDRGEERIPVLVGSWTEEQELLLLASLDPISAMARADASVLDALLADIQTDDGPMRDLLASLATQPTPIDDAPPPGSGSDTTSKNIATCPKCSCRFSP